MLPGLRGSITTEAALVLPVFLFFCMNLFSLLETSRLQTRITYGMWKAGKELANYGYLLRNEKPSKLEGFVLSESVVRGDVTRYIGQESLKNPVLMGGAYGLSFAACSFPKGGDILDLQVRYFIAPVPGVFGVGMIPMGSRYYGHSWTGYAPPSPEEEGNEKEEYVFITEHGEVYHRTDSCTYLKPKIEGIPLAEAKKAVNADGSHYKPCRYCGSKEVGAEVYITQYGESYHSDLNCSAISHTIYCVPISQAEGRRECSKCGRNQ
ncbi:MAG: pilus assembly protein [Lachnospiraceae bacterium]|nr:pilus assembly protein [Lachnospiraceae bacterium]